MRNVDRTVRDLQSQIDRRDKINAQLSDDVAKSRDKLERLLATIDELQSSDSTNQLQARRAERDLREEREKALRLERELEGWKALRMERGSLGRNGMGMGMGFGEGDGGERERRRVSVAGSGSGEGGGGVARKASTTKGFL